jgi:hypothetical protein
MSGHRIAVRPRALPPRHITLRQLSTEQQRWQAYEAAKHLWECQHPGASADEHEQAMRALAERHGV